jgi:hypothetical protein
MSVITAMEPVPNRIRSLVRIVAAAGPLGREEVAAYLMPGTQPKHDQVGNILREALRLHLLTETDRGIELPGGIRPRDAANDAWFENHVERALFSRDLGEDDENRPVAFATAWLLTRPAAPDLVWRSDLATEMRRDMEGEDIYDVTNVDRSAMLAYWVRFSGYGEALGWDGRTFIIPDPTRAIARHLDLLPIGETLAFPRFLNSLAERLPVLEGGAIRAQVEARLRRKRNAATLSPATSLALLRLELRGLITMRAESDAQPRMLLDRGGDGPRLVTHVSKPRNRA